MRTRAAELAESLGAYRTDQFTNTDMVEGYRRLGDEAAAQVPGDIDALCLYVGTAGCLLGVSRSLRRRYPAMLRVAVEPAESAVLSGRPAGTHRIEGGGVGFRPDLLGPDDVDEVVPVSTADAFAMARRAARVEGLLSGPSTGANLVAALHLARRLGPGRRVLTAQVDSGLKYLTGSLFTERVKLGDAGRPLIATLIDDDRRFVAVPGRRRAPGDGRRPVVVPTTPVTATPARLRTFPSRFGYCHLVLVGAPP